MIKPQIGLFLIVMFLFSRATFALDKKPVEPAHLTPETEEINFQKKAKLMLRHLAQNPTIPQAGDREKYAWPAVIARLAQDPQDPWSKKILQEFSQRTPESFYTNRDAFAAPGMTRILYLYDHKTNLSPFERNYLQFLFARPAHKGHYNFWQSGGTENFVNMLRTSGYLLAQRGIKNHIKEAPQKADIMEKWLLEKSQKTYQMGVSEWDSSLYSQVSLIGWLNLYDFAKDVKVKKAAQAMLDYYASAIALKYTYGIYSGAEQRGGAALEPIKSNVDYLGWLWFGEKIPTKDNFWVWPGYITLVHAATSSYRPPKEAIALARKTFVSEDNYHNTKANYSLSKLEIPEFFYIGKNYTLGTALVEQGDQIVNWKLVSYPQSNQSAMSVTGANSYYQGKKNGVGKTIYDKYLQTKNVLVQMTYIPPNIKADVRRQTLRSYLAQFISKLYCGNSCQFVLQRKLEKLIPLKAYPIQNINDNQPVKNYISYPRQAVTTIKDGHYFIQVNQTYLAISPFPPLKITPQIDTKTNRLYLENQASLGQLTGFIMEVGNQYDQGSFQQFQDQIIKKTNVDLSQIAQGKLDYRSLDGSELAVDYQFNQSLPMGMLNHQPIRLENSDHSLYQGDRLQIKDRRLRIQDDQSLYEVDYRGQAPIFSRTKR